MSKLLTETEKRDLIFIPACLLNATVAIAGNELRKAITKMRG